MARKRAGTFDQATRRAVATAHPALEPTGEDPRSVDNRSVDNRSVDNRSVDNRSVDNRRSFPDDFLDDTDRPSSPATNRWAPRPGRPKPEGSSRAYQVSFNDSSNYLG
jgi:hypothetical protein